MAMLASRALLCENKNIHQQNVTPVSIEPLTYSHASSLGYQGLCYLGYPCDIMGYVYCLFFLLNFILGFGSLSCHLLQSFLLFT